MTTTKTRHYDEIRQALISGGEMDHAGRLRAWYGRKTLERLRAAGGHTSLDPDKCACMSGVTAPLRRESRSR